MHRVEPVLPDRQEKEKWLTPDGTVIEVPVDADLPVHYILGDPEDFLWVSVPVETSPRAAAELQAVIEKATPKKVLILTHNIQLVKITRLSSSEATRFLGQVERANDDESKTGSKILGDAGDGDRPGVREDGDGNPEASEDG